MKILFLTQFFWPEVRTAPTNLAALAKDLQHSGHEIMVITGFPNHPFGQVYDGYNLRHWQWDEVGGVKVLRLPLYPDHSSSKWRRLLNYGSFALSSSTLGALFSRDFDADVIFVYYAPLSIGGPAALLRWLHDAPVVYWITDLWPENLLATGMPVGKGYYAAIQRVENWGYELADAICVDSPGFETRLIKKGVVADKIHIVAEWADESIFFPIKPDGELAQTYELSGKFNVIYGGNLGTVQHLGTVVSAARLVCDIEDIQFVFIGDGVDAENLRRQVHENKLENVRFIPRQPLEQIHRFFAMADVLLVHLKREAIFELQLPSKVIAYMACGRPILCAVPGTAAKIVLDAGAGLSCLNEDPEALAQQVRTFYEMPRSEREAMGKSGRRTYLANYTRQVQVGRIEKILEKIVNESPRVKKIKRSTEH